MQNIDPEIEKSWKEVLREEFSQDYFSQLKTFLVAEKQQHTVYPPGNLIFSAF